MGLGKFCFGPISKSGERIWRVSKSRFGIELCFASRSLEFSVSLQYKFRSRILKLGFRSRSKSRIYHSIAMQMKDDSAVWSQVTRWCILCCGTMVGLYVWVNKRGSLISWNFLSFCRFYTGRRILTFDGALNLRLLNFNVEISLHQEQGHSLWSLENRLLISAKLNH